MPSPIQDAPAKREAPVRIVEPVLLLVTLLWGLNNVANKWVLEFLGPAGILAVRFAGCSLVMGLATWYLSRRRPAPDSRPWGVMVGVGLWVATQQLSFIFALDLTTASEGSLLISVAPIWTALAGALTGIEALRLANWVGIAGASAGVAMIVLGGGDLNAALPSRVAGDLLMLFSSVLYGVGMTFLKTVMDRYGSLRVLTWAFMFGTLLVIPCGLRDLQVASWATFPPLAWAALGHSAFVAGGFGFVAWYRTIARTTATRTAVYQYLVPVIALVLAAILLGERMGPLQLAGSALAISGLAMARWTR